MLWFPVIICTQLTKLSRQLDLEYADYIKCILGITLKCIWWWGYSSGDLRVEYPSIAITNLECTC